jgi:hypothetical protein
VVLRRARSPMPIAQQPTASRVYALSWGSMSYGS